VPRPHPVGRHVHERVRTRRRRGLRIGGVAALLAVVGPGVLAGLSDDDPPGITTYSKLGADYGYELIWVVVVATIALIVFHEVAVRTGVVTGKGLMTLVHERHGPRTAAAVVGALVVANFGTLCAEFAGLAAGAQILFGVGRGIAIPIATITPAARFAQRRRMRLLLVRTGRPDRPHPDRRLQARRRPGN